MKTLMLALAALMHAGAATLCWYISPWLGLTYIVLACAGGALAFVLYRTPREQSRW